MEIYIGDIASSPIFKFPLFRWSFSDFSNVRKDFSQGISKRISKRIFIYFVPIEDVIHDVFEIIHSKSTFYQGF